MGRALNAKHKSLYLISEARKSHGNFVRVKGGRRSDIIRLVIDFSLSPSICLSILSISLLGGPKFDHNSIHRFAKLTSGMNGSDTTNMQVSTI